MGAMLRILKIDSDKDPVAATNYKIQSVPTLILLQNGKTLWRQSGVLQTSQLMALIQQ